MQDLILLPQLPSTPIHELLQVTTIAICHGNAQLISAVCKERVLVRDNVGMHELLQQHDFIPGCFALLARDTLQLDDLHAIVFALTFVTHKVHLAEGALADASEQIVVFHAPRHGSRVQRSCGCGTALHPQALHTSPGTMFSRALAK